MPDWYDRLLTRLGLDSVRNDQLLGVPLREFTPLEFSNSPGVLKPSLCSLPDGRTQIVFQATASGDRWVGFLPCTLGNLHCLEQFLVGAPSAVTGPGQDGEPLGLWTRFLHRIRPPRRIVTMAPPADRHLDSVVEWALVQSSKGTRHLEFTLRGPRGFFRRRITWTPKIAAWLNEIATVGRRNSCDWTSSRSPGD